MPVDVSFEPIAPSSANPEVAANTALTKLGVAITTVEAGATGLPPGGDTGQVLTKLSNDDGDASWDDPASGSGVPPGGMTGEVLTKVSNDDGDAVWAPSNASGGASVPIGGEHEYWRLQFIGPNPGGGRSDYVNLSEIEFRSVIGGLAVTPMTILASGEYDPVADGKGEAFDGIKTGSNRWLSQLGSMTTGNIWIGARFSSAIRVGQILVAKGIDSPELNPYNFNLQYSDDGITWTSVITLSTGFTDAQVNVEVLCNVPLQGYPGVVSLVAGVYRFDDAGNVVDSRARNIASFTRVNGGEYLITFTIPLPSMFVHFQGSCFLGVFPDMWSSRLEIGRRTGADFTVNQITVVVRNQDGAKFDPRQLEFKITEFVL